MLRNENYFLKRGVQAALSLKGVQHHITRTVKEVLFDGYEDFFLNLGHQFPIIDMPQMDKFAWLYKVHTYTNILKYFLRPIANNIY